MALAHKASHEAKIVAHNIMQETQQSIRKDNMVAIAFTQPEAATVGLSIKEIDDRHLVNSFDYSANGRSLTVNQQQGFVRLIVLKENQQLVGAQIIGYNASELIGECSLAIENKLTTQHIIDTIHAHPTQHEMIMDVAEDILGFPIPG